MRTAGFAASSLDRLARAAIVLVVVGATGCPFVVPTPGVQDRAPSADIVPRLEPGVSTRVDVLMLLGDPDLRGEEDRFFVYDWRETHAVYGLLLPGGGLLASGIGDRHALGIEFTRDGRVAKLRQFATRSTSSEADAAVQLWEEIRAWMTSPEEPSR